MKLFIENTRLSILVALIFIFLGIKGLKNLQRESIPPVDFARAFISTIYPGSSASQVEELVTKKIEDEIRSIPHLKDVQSSSKPSLSLITIRINIDKADTKEVINEISQNMQNIQALPKEVLDSPRLVHLDSSRHRPILNLYLSGPDDHRKKDYYSKQLKDKIENLEEVLEVQLENYKKREFTIFLSNKKMSQYYISKNDVISSLEKQKMDIPAGYLESNQTRSLTRLMGNFRTVEELENIIVRSNFSGNKIQIKDIAVVKDSFEKENEKGYIYSSNSNKTFELKPAVALSVLKTSSSDLIDTVTKVKQVTKEFKKTLPKAYDILEGFDESKNTKKRLSSVINNALTGLFLIFIVFFLFLPAWSGLMASFSLPLSLLAVFCFLPFMGVSFNIITMLAFVICIGMLVDNSVVIAEYYSRLTTENKIPARQAALEASRRFFKPILATVLTTIAAFLPMLFTTGVMGEFIKWIPIVITLALILSLFEAFCLLPNRLQWRTQTKPSFYQVKIINAISKIENGFEVLLKHFINKKYLTLAGLASLFIFSGLLFKFGVKVDLFSKRSPEAYTARIEAQPNLPLSVIDEKTKDIAKQMQTIFGGHKTIEWMHVRSNVESGEILLKVKPSVLRRLKYEEILEQLRKIPKDSSLKELDFGVMVGGPPVGKALNVALLSNDRKQIRSLIDKVYPEISKIKGLLNLKSDPDTNKGTEYKINIKPEALAKLGLDFRSVGLTLRTALEGTIITEITEQNESFYIRIKHGEEDMSSVENLKKLQIKEMMGRQVPLEQVADIREVFAEPDKKTYNFSPVIFLSANVDPKITTSLLVNKQTKKIIDKEIGNYPSVSYKLIGEQETTQESLKSLFQAGAIAFFAILIILIVLFKSFILSFLILSCIPLGLIGVILSFFLHGRPLTFFAMIGIVGLAGVVVNSAIILISFILSLQKEEPQLNLKDVALKASKIRFRPILITNLTTLGGMLPTAYGIPSFEPLLMPMTLALFWGLFTATLLTLIWIPCAFLVVEDIKQKIKRFT